MKSKVLVRKLGGCLIAAALSFPGIVSANPFPPPPDIAPNHVNRVSPPPGLPAALPPFMDDLQLNEEQMDHVFLIKHEFALPIYQAQRSAEKFTHALRELSAAQNFDESKARELATAVGNVIGELNLLYAKRNARMLSVLNAQQRGEFANRKNRHEVGRSPNDMDSPRENRR